MAIYISGSLAYDRIMSFPGHFTDAILPDQIHNLNVSFFIDKLDEQLGGNAGNIAHSLYLLGEPSVIVGSAGKDFQRYRDLLRSRGLSEEGITYLPNELTAGAYITTDRRNNQITAFHAAAMMTPSEYAFPHLDPAMDYCIICPSNPDDMRRHPRVFRERSVRYIYDPAQQLPVLSDRDVLDAVNGAFLLIGNDYEIQLIMNMTKKTKEELVSMTDAGVITTLGDQGSLISAKDGTQTRVAAVPVSAVVDPTGAGDAYRSGLLKGLVDGKSLVRSAQLGAVCAAYCIEAQGTQGHTFTQTDFNRRLLATFGEQQ